MNSYQSSILRRFRRVREFLAAHPLTDAPPSFTAQVSELDDVMSKVSDKAQQQNTGTRWSAAEAARQRAFRETLWTHHMLPIARIAREAFGVPGVPESLRMPKKSSDNDRLLSAARGMADTAEREKAVFTGHGLSDDFVERLRGAASTLSDALTARDVAGRSKVQATKGVDVQLKRGSRAVRVINAILAPRLANDPELAAAWKNAKRLTQPVGGGASAVPAAPVESQTQPVTQPQPATQPVVSGAIAA
jgi:hypothetical protein